MLVVKEAVYIPSPLRVGVGGYMENLGASHSILCNPKTALKNKV